MRLLVESLRRLFVCGNISSDVIVDMKNNGKISCDEAEYILSQNK